MIESHHQVYIMLNLHLLFVNITSFFLIKPLVNFSLDSENGSGRIISFGSSISHSGIIKSSLSSLKYSIVFLITFLGKSADKNFLIVRFTSKLKSLAILLARCSSAVAALCLYLLLCLLSLYQLLCYLYSVFNQIYQPVS